MRFAISMFSARYLRLSGNANDWPMILRMAVVIVPVCACIALCSTWLGYSAASISLVDSLENLPLLKARAQADRLNSVYARLRHSLEHIAQMPSLSAQEAQERCGFFFQDNTLFLSEFGVYSKDGKGFLLVRDEAGFREVAGAGSATGENPFFQQISSHPLLPGKAVLFPAVFAYHPSAAKERPRKVPVIRMALPFADGSGALVAGIDLDALQKEIGVYSRADSPLGFSLQEGGLQLSYFFDTEGWILFEMAGSKNSGFLPDIARHGYTGDLGRPGYDAAFRPWGVHEDYWSMVTQIKDNRSGSFLVTAEHFPTAQAQNRAFLCYAPVYFAQSAAAAPQVIGGIAFFETSYLPLAAFLRAANMSLFVVSGSIVVIGILLTLIGRRLSKPLDILAGQLVSMNDSGEVSTLETTPMCMEHQKLLAATNSLIARLMTVQINLELARREIAHTHARFPVDLYQLVSSPPASTEFDLVGSSSLIKEVRDQVRKAARAGTDVLIWGETGTGKELVAAAIHKESSRRGGPYISINCGALDESLLMDTLFGHVKGAFTEAKTERKGAFLSADGGTLLLDEIANASFKVQQTLLRALSVRRIRPLGADIEVSFNTRVIAATNVDLRECVRAGTFREDLYYRLAIISIASPPLRHHKEDIPQLAAFCIREAAVNMGHPEARLSRGALELLAAYDWPGNVRELKNCLTRAMAFVEGDLILPRHIILEQDAFRAYGKPVPPQVLAGRVKAGDFREPSLLTPYRSQKREDAGAERVQAGAQCEQESKNSSGEGAQHSPMGEGHAAEYLWPAPPRETFTPARAEADDGEEADARSGGGAAIAPENLDFGAVSDTRCQTKAFGESPRALPAQVFGVSSLSDSIKDSSSGRDAEAGLQSRYKRPDSDGIRVRMPGSGDMTVSVSSSFPVSLKVPSPVITEPDQGNTRQASGPLACLNDRQARALHFLRVNGAITRAQYEGVAGQDLSARTAQNDLRELVALGVLERLGAGPSVYYVLSRQKEEV